MNVIEQIKGKQGIVDVAEHLIPNLKKSSNRLIGTIRNEKTPALTIYPETQSWFHFAGDTTPKGKQGGDIIDLVEYVQNCDTNEAIKFLADFFHISYQPFTREEKEKIEKQRLAQNILLFAAIYYHDNLFKPESVKYLQHLHSRGFSEDTLKRNLIGVAGSDKELLNCLRNRGFSLEEIKMTNLISETGHDYFQYRITFPLFKNGSVVYVTSRETEDTPNNEWERGRKYKHLPTNEWIKNDYFYNEDALDRTKETIICEGIPDTLTLQQWGFNAVAVLGNHLKDELAKKLNHLKTVYIALDPDGKSDPLKFARDIGNKAKIISLPKGEADVNERATKGELTKENFGKLLNEAKNLIEYQLPSDLREYRVDTSELNTIKITKNDFEYQISQIEERKSGLRAIITLFRDGRKLNRDRVLLVSGKSRKTFANDCTENTKVKQEVKQHLINIEEILSLLSSPKKKEGKERKGTLTKEEREVAIELLKSPTFLYDVKSLFPRLLVAGEERNCILIYLSGTSRILDSPISLTGKGESSIGKSYVIEKVLKLFPLEAYEDISDATARSFYHAEKDAFKHKIMVFFEKPGTEQTDYSIRLLQSEKKLKLQITVKNPQTGEFGMEIKEVEGPVVFITTTTNPQIHAENETRCFSWYGDASENQTLDTFEMTDAKYRGIEEVSEKELQKFKNAQRVLKPYPVFIPYVEEIRKSFPRKPIRVRRDYGRLLVLIEVITVLHQFQREKKEINGKEYLVSTLADYYIAKVIGENIIRETIFELPPKSRQIVKEARKFLKEKEAEEEEPTFTIRELSRKLREDYDTTHKWFRLAFERGYFEINEEHKGQKAAKYVLTKMKPENTVILPSVEELAEKYPEYLGEVYDPITGEKIAVKTSYTDAPTENKNT